jgi:hypothetical protein
MVLLCTLHVRCSHGDEKDFLSIYTAWCQVYNSRLTFLYLLYILGIFHLFMHIEAGQKSQTSRFLSILVLVVMKQIGSKWIVFTNLWKCYFTVWPITADRRMLILCTQLNCFLFYALGIGWIRGKNVGRRQLNKWNVLKLSLLAHLCMVRLNWDANPFPVLFTRPRVITRTWTCVLLFLYVKLEMKCDWQFHWNITF